MGRDVMMRRFSWIFLFVMALSACQLSLPGRGAPNAAGAGAGSAGDVAQSITGEAIEVTSLDDAPAAPEAAAAPAKAAAEPPAEAPEAATGPEPEAAVVEEAAPEPPPVVKGPAQLACEKRSGVWTMAASGLAAFCQKTTRDGGKSCSAAGDCEGYCLARSRSCSPVTPMLGCQEILNENGQILTECIN